MNYNLGTIVGKTVNACIARPGPGQRNRVYMMMFTDGSCYEFVSGRKPQQAATPNSVDSPTPITATADTQVKQLCLRGF